MAQEYARKLNAGFVDAVAAASNIRDAVKPMTDAGKVFHQAVQRSAAQPFAAQAAMADVGQGFSKIAEQYLRVVRRIGFDHQFGRLLPKLELPDFRHITEPLARQLRMEQALDDSGWLPHHSTPLESVKACAGDREAIQVVLRNYYCEEWEAVRRATETRLTTCSLDDEAKATFREALTAHEAGLYRSVCRLLFPEIERVARKELRGDSLEKDLSGQPPLHELARNLPVSVARRAGFLGLHLCRRLSSHLYKSVWDDDTRQRFAEDPVPNRHAVVHGLVEYSSMQNSLNAIFMTEFLFSTIIWLRDEQSRPTVDA